MAQEIFDKIQRRRQKLRNSEFVGNPDVMEELRILNWVMRLYYEHKASFKRRVITEKTKKKRKKAARSPERRYLRINQRRLL
jgi:hypothetical protein